ncbi:unnamed protein product [Sphagnum troendelagicum]|uniref:Uncharacterized protein n=1 Tax=Sphagnum troendelagicum TaxID=128251 RepID=A0ABP0UM81_9BRYO
MRFAGFARSTALDGAQLEPEWNGAWSNFTMHVVSFSSSSIVALSILFIHFYCPETKGKTLEEIAKFLSGTATIGSPPLVEMESLHLNNQNGDCVALASQP